MVCYNFSYCNHITKSRGWHDVKKHISHDLGYKTKTMHISEIDETKIIVISLVSSDDKIVFWA